MKKTGVQLITEERIRQIVDENWSESHDSEHTKGELALAAACYALTSTEREKYQSFSFKNNKEKFFPRWWPWDVIWWKPSPENRIKELVKAGALIAAEIDRLSLE